MPKKIDTNELSPIYEAYLQHGSLKKTAIALNVPLHRVSKAVYRFTGRCQCGRQPAEGYLTCEHCLERSRRNTVKRHTQRAQNGICRECGAPLAPNSKRFCEQHLEKGRQEQRVLRKYRRDNNICRLCTHPVVEGKAYCENHFAQISERTIRNRSRYIFGGFLEAVLERDNRQCRICGSKEPRMEVHHIHGRVNSMENLITLCIYCHKAVTFLNYCCEPEAVYAWFLEHRP